MDLNEFQNIDWTDLQYRIGQRLQDRSGLPQARAENIAEYVVEMVRAELTTVREPNGKCLECGYNVHYGESHDSECSHA
jgi:hypothetical protein